MSVVKEAICWWKKFKIEITFRILFLFIYCFLWFKHGGQEFWVLLYKQRVMHIVLKTDTLSTYVRMQIHSRRLMGMLKLVMVMWVVDMVFKVATLSTNVKIKAPLRITMGESKMVMLVVDMFIWKERLIYNKMVWNHWWLIMIRILQI